MTKAYVKVHIKIEKHDRTCKPRMSVYYCKKYKTIQCNYYIQSNIKQTMHDERSLVKIYGT